MSEETPLALERVRVVCRDRAGRVLLIKWRDPADGRLFFEPPGGGIEPGESARAAAARELFEETGYQVPISAASVEVAREYDFAGRHHRHVEAIFLAEVDGPPAAAAFTEEEMQTFLEWRFVDPAELGSLEEPLEPPELAAVISELFDW